MSDPVVIQRFLADSDIDDATNALRLHDHVLLLAVIGLAPDPSDVLSCAICCWHIRGARI